MIILNSSLKQLHIRLIAVTQSTNSMPRQPHAPNHGDCHNSPWRIMLQSVSVPKASIVHKLHCNYKNFNCILNVT